MNRWHRLVAAFVFLFVLFCVAFQRSAHSSPVATSGPSNIVVICSSCAYPGLPREGHLIIMDNRTGDIWAYSDEAVAGRGAPVYMGTIAGPGKAVTKR